jgi:hypothetical protein
LKTPYTNATGAEGKLLIKPKIKRTLIAAWLGRHEAGCSPGPTAPKPESGGMKMPNNVYGSAALRALKVSRKNPAAMKLYFSFMKKMLVQSA